MKNVLRLFLAALVGCSSPDSIKIFDLLEGEPRLAGNDEYRDSPFVTAGDRVYVVGHQNGTFPDLGWHVDGEMGGVWNHPIKLLDGYSLKLSDESGLNWCLNKATDFYNFPFGNLLVYEKEKLALEVQQFQFVPEGEEGLIISYQILNSSTESASIDLTFSAFSDLQPVWLWDSLNIKDAPDEMEWDQTNQTLVFKDSSNPWSVGIRSSEVTKTSKDASCSWERKGTGTSGSLQMSINVPAGESKVLQFYVAGSTKSETETNKTLDRLQSNSTQLLAEKIRGYNELSAQSQLSVPDKELVKMYQWTKYNTQWLVRDVPEVGRGVSAGIPDYPWWFGTDNGYTLQGLLAAGMHDEVLSTIDLIFKLSKQVNGSSGKIMHEASTNGVVFNSGNLNTTPNFIYALWKTYEWTGSEKILGYYDDIKNGISWLESQDQDGNGYPDGPGMMEIPGLHTEMIDVVAYQIKGYQAAGNFAVVMGEEEQAEKYRTIAKELQERLNSEWWSDSFGSYADFRSTKEEAVELTEAAILRADTIDKPWSVDELRQTLNTIEETDSDGILSYVVHHNWVVNTPMEMGLADPDKATVALETARKYTNRFGMFVTGIDRDEEQETSTKWKAFSYVGAVMTLPTGVQAISEAKYGNPERSLEYIKNLQNSFGYALPGSMYEVSPDFGMIVQAWNIYAVAVPIVNHLFGIYPMAHREEVVFAPSLPESWESGSLENVRVGSNLVSISFEKSKSQKTYTITQTKDWSLKLEIPFEGKMYLNGQPVLSDFDTEIIGLELTGEENTLVVEL